LSLLNNKLAPNHTQTKKLSYTNTKSSSNSKYISNFFIYIKGI